MYTIRLKPEHKIKLVKILEKKKHTELNGRVERMAPHQKFCESRHLCHGTILTFVCLCVEIENIISFKSSSAIEPNRHTRALSHTYTHLVDYLSKWFVAAMRNKAKNTVLNLKRTYTRISVFYNSCITLFHRSVHIFYTLILFLIRFFYSYMELRRPNFSCYYAVIFLIWRSRFHLTLHTTIQYNIQTFLRYTQIYST